MPDYICTALNERGLMDAYHSRPAYQQNDYVGWITRAKLETIAAEAGVLATQAASR